MWTGNPRTLFHPTPDKTENGGRLILPVIVLWETLLVTRVTRSGLSSRRSADHRVSSGLGTRYPRTRNESHLVRKSGGDRRAEWRDKVHRDRVGRYAPSYPRQGSKFTPKSLNGSSRRSPPGGETVRGFDPFSGRDPHLSPVPFPTSSSFGAGTASDRDAVPEPYPLGLRRDPVSESVYLWLSESCHRVQDNRFRH